MFAKQKLTPEQRRAVRKVEEVLPELDFVRLCAEPFPSEFYNYPGTLFFIDDILATSELPKGETWNWNQSRSRITLEAPLHNISLTFFKLRTIATRKSKGNTPSSKIWLYNLHVGQDIVSFVWVEKGVKGNSFASLDIKDFLFLAPFLDANAAEEFDWL